MTLWTKKAEKDWTCSVTVRGWRNHTLFFNTEIHKIHPVTSASVLWANTSFKSQVWACRGIPELRRVALLIVICKHARNALFCQTTGGGRIMGNCGCSLWLQCHRDATDMTQSSLQLWGERERQREEGAGEHSGQTRGKDQNSCGGGVCDEWASLRDTVRKSKRERVREWGEENVRECGEDVVAREQRGNRNVHLSQRGGGLNSWIISGKMDQTWGEENPADPDSGRPKGTEEKVGRCDYITTITRRPYGWHHHSRIRAWARMEEGVGYSRNKE